MPIRWGDMDAMGHVNNTLYFRYFEIIRIDWFDRARRPAESGGEGPVIVNAFCNFIQQLEYPGDVLAKHYVANPGRTSFETYMTLERTDHARRDLRYRAARTTVWVDFPKQKSVPLPDWLRALVGARWPPAESRARARSTLRPTAAC